MTEYFLAKDLSYLFKDVIEAEKRGEDFESNIEK
jgi:hypothetical protein